MVDDGTNTANSKLFLNLIPGQTYTITEVPPTNGYPLFSISCTGGGTGSTILDLGQVSLTLAPGENVVCTFLNSAIRVRSGTTGSAPLAFTGSSAGHMFELGSILAALGLALVMIDVRRRRRHERLLAQRVRID